MIKRYQKRPVTIEAVQYTGENFDEIMDFMDFMDFVEQDILAGDPIVVIHTLEGDMTATPGDFIIKGVRGEFYPCKPDIFAETYIEAEE